MRNLPPRFSQIFQSRVKFSKAACIGFSAGIVGTSLIIKDISVAPKALANPSMLEFRWDQNDNYFLRL